MLWSSQSLNESTSYVVILRYLRTANGSLVQPSPAFKSLRYYIHVMFINKHVCTCNYTCPGLPPWPIYGHDYICTCWYSSNYKLLLPWIEGGYIKSLLRTVVSRYTNCIVCVLIIFIIIRDTVLTNDTDIEYRRTYFDELFELLHSKYGKWYTSFTLIMLLQLEWCHNV